jgi:hypothetical protein
MRLKLVGEPHNGRLAVDKLVADDSGARQQTGMSDGLVAQNERGDGNAAASAMLAAAQCAAAADVASRSGVVLPISAKLCPVSAAPCRPRLQNVSKDKRVKSTKRVKS